MIFAASLFAITFSACSDDGDDNNDVAVTGITLSESSITLVAGGETATLTATVTPDNATDKTVTWTSSDTSVATVEDGVVTPVAAGTATITAKAGDQTAECEVTVNPEGTIIPVTKVELNKTSLSLKEGGEETLTATVTPATATDKTVTWTSSDTDVATVENGKVTAVAEGTATITAKAGEQTATCAVTVVAKDADIVAVTGITLNKTTLSLEEGGKETLTATVLPATATNKTVTWSSDKTDVATVDSNGKVTAVAEGTATITAKAGDQTAECAVTVTAAVALTGISLDKETLSLAEGKSETLTATLEPEGAKADITWSSSDTGVATVDSNGKVTAVAAGNAEITATAGAHKATCTVTVTEADKISFFVDSSEADFEVKKFAAGSDITGNSLFTLNATVAMETSFGNSYGALQDGSNAVSFKNMAGEDVKPNVGIKLGDDLKATGDSSSGDSIDNIFTVTAKKDIELNVYVDFTNNSFNSNRTGDITYKVNSEDSEEKVSITARKSPATITVSLKQGEVLTVGAENKHSGTARLWLLGAEAKVSAE